MVVEDLLVGYRGRALLPPVNARLLAGELWALVGRNGGGKTTLMRTLLGLQPSVGGTARLQTEARVSYVPQRLSFDLSVPSRVRDFVRDGAETSWSFLTPWRSDKSRVDAALRDAGVADLAGEQLATLSEGQKQRAVVARALVTEPDLLVLDEPTSAMDPINERQIFALIGDIARQRDMAVLVASHQMSFLPEFANHALLVDKDLGVALNGPLKDVFRSADFRRIYGNLHLGTPEEDGCV